MAATKQEKDFQTHANEYAQRSIESMRDDLAALKHAQECTEEGCTIGQETKSGKLRDGKKYTQNIHNNPEAWHDEDAARQAIEDVLDVAIDKGERFDGTRHYMILLGTGGPAARITGELNEHGEVETAEFQFQDWFKPWTAADLSQEDEATLLEYAQQFSFYE